jgi:hypothetical protein
MRKLLFLLPVLLGACDPVTISMAVKGAEEAETLIKDAQAPTPPADKK